MGWQGAQRHSPWEASGDPGHADSPFSRCWKEGENSLAVIRAMRASSWAFWAAVRAASALAREWEVLGGGDGRAMRARPGQGTRHLAGGRLARPRLQGLGALQPLRAQGRPHSRAGPGLGRAPSCLRTPPPQVLATD